MKISLAIPWRVAARISFWAIMIGAFLWVSVPKILSVTSKNSSHLFGPFYSTDSFLFFDTGQARASERLIAFFDSIPASEPIIIYVRGDDRRSSFIGMMVAYLAWPHPVRIVDAMDREQRKELLAHGFPAPGACVFCRLDPPPSWRRGERFGSTLEVVAARKIANR